MGGRRGCGSVVGPPAALSLVGRTACEEAAGTAAALQLAGCVGTAAALLLTAARPAGWAPAWLLRCRWRGALALPLRCCWWARLARLASAPQLRCCWQPSPGAPCGLGLRLREGGEGSERQEGLGHDRPPCRQPVAAQQRDSIGGWQLLLLRRRLLLLLQRLGEWRGCEGGLARRAEPPAIGGWTPEC